MTTLDRYQLKEVRLEWHRKRNEERERKILLKLVERGHPEATKYWLSQLAHPPTKPSAVVLPPSAINPSPPAIVPVIPATPPATPPNVSCPSPVISAVEMIPVTMPEKKSTSTTRVINTNKRRRMLKAPCLSEMLTWVGVQGDHPDMREHLSGILGRLKEACATHYFQQPDYTWWFAGNPEAVSALTEALNVICKSHTKPLPLLESEKKKKQPPSPPLPTKQPLRLVPPSPPSKRAPTRKKRMLKKGKKGKKGKEDRYVANTVRFTEEACPPLMELVGVKLTGVQYRTLGRRVFMAYLKRPPTPEHPLPRYNICNALKRYPLSESSWIQNTIAKLLPRILKMPAIQDRNHKSETETPPSKKQKQKRKSGASASSGSSSSSDNDETPEEKESTDDEVKEITK